jgi:hypothetical protein
LPVLLDETCLMRLVVFGEVVRMRHKVLVCSIERYEFRTQARSGPVSMPPSVRETLRRWPQPPPREIKAAAVLEMRRNAS